MTSDFNIAVHAVLYLYHHPGSSTSLQLSESICTNPARIRKVLLLLKKAGIVEAKEGAGKSGYQFKGTRRMKLSTIAEAVGTDFIGSSWISGKDNHTCPIAENMPEIMNDIYDDMNQACLKELSKISIHDIAIKIF